jgi:hypothetical protein
MKALSCFASSFTAGVSRPAFFLTLLFASFTALAQETPRFEAGGNFVALRSGGTGTFGPGGTFVYNFKRFLSLEGSVNWLPNGTGFSVLGNGSSTLEGLFGVKAGYRTEKFGIFGKFRPGLIHQNNALRGEDLVPIQTLIGPGTSIVPRFSGLTERAFDIGQVLEYYPSRHWAFRYDIGDLVVFNEPIVLTGTGGTIPSSIFGNSTRATNNFQFSTGVHYRF